MLSYLVHVKVPSIIFMAQPTEGVLSSEESANTVQSSNVHALLKELEAAHALIRELQDEKTRRTN